MTQLNYYSGLSGRFAAVTYGFRVLTGYRIFLYFVRDCNGRTPLHFAAACGHVGILNGLLQVAGSGVHMDNHGYTPLHWACFNGTYSEYLELS